MNLYFESFDPSFDYSKFDCGHDALNQFLIKRAATEETQRLSKTKIVKNDQDEIVGFYTISPGVIAKERLASSESRGVVYSEVPAIRIGRLAVHKDYQKSGIGKVILKDALLRCLNISNQLGGRVIIVDAKDAVSASFYMKFGFKPIKDHPLVLILKISTLEKSLLT